MNIMDQMNFILVNESLDNDCIVVRFMVNNQEVLPKIEFKLTKNYSEQYSSVLFEHLNNHIPKEFHYLYFNEPLECMKKSRFNLIAYLSVDVILKILNIKYIPIIRTNYSRYTISDAIQEGSTSVIDKMNQSWQRQCKFKSKMTKEFMSTLNEFKYYYRIEILMTSTLQQIKQEIYSEYDVLYVPTDDLIFLKTNKKQKLSLSSHNLEQIKQCNQLI
ncbi:unnamed protein product [Paramecium sonneborni]|uniref:Uncharacterized protein n=1 Tax=Paramecium sonneborni TaxID=65129 RepID=A0A8S1JYV2_9CILI|nr:unnamed protein product [Paramecium sonneborni]